MMYTAVCRLEIRVPGCTSLKDKRRVVRSIIDRLRRLNLSVAEVDAHDLWQRSVIGVACVARERSEAVRAIQSVIEWVVRQHDSELLSHEVQIY